MINKRKDVQLDVIAKALTACKWFDKFDFAVATNIDLRCVNTRLRRMVKENHLETRPGKKRKLLYMMTVESKLLMIEACKKNKKNRGKPKVKFNRNAKDMLILETEAHKEAAEGTRYLVKDEKEIGFSNQRRVMLEEI